MDAREPRVGERFFPSFTDAASRNGEHEKQKV